MMEQIAKLLEDVELIKVTKEDVGRNGSKKGDEIIISTYHVPGISGTYHSKEWALRNYVIEKLKPTIKQAIKEYLNKH